MNGQLSRATVLVLVIVALGFGLRLYRLDAQSFWYDEAMSAGIARGTVTQILRNDFYSPHPPLYFLTLHFWLSIDQSDLTIRLLSAMLGAAGIAGMYCLGKILCDGVVGLAAAAIAAVVPYQVFYSQEARMYTLVFLLSTLLLLSYVRMLRTDTLRWWVAYTALAALSLYTHLFSGLLLLSLHFHFVISRTPLRKPWRRFAASDGLVILAFIPRLTVTLVQAGRVAGDFWIPRPSLAQLLSAPHAFTLSQQVSGRLVPLAFAVVLFLFIITHLQVARELAKRGRETTGLTLALIAFWSPLLLTFVLSQWQPVYLERTLMVAVPGLYLMLSWGMARPKERLVNSILALMVLVFAANGLWNWNFDPDFAKPDLRAAAELLQEKVEEGELTVHTSDGAFLVFSHYAPDCRRYLLEGDPAPAVPAETYELFGGKIIAKEEVSAPQFWLVVALDNSIEFQRGLVDWFDARHALRESYDLGGIYLRHYDAGQNSRE
jgi:mannosyltransferase